MKLPLHEGTGVLNVPLDHDSLQQAEGKVNILLHQSLKNIVYQNIAIDHSYSGGTSSVMFDSQNHVTQSAQNNVVSEESDIQDKSLDFVIQLEDGTVVLESPGFKTPVCKQDICDQDEIQGIDMDNSPAKVGAFVGSPPLLPSSQKDDEDVLFKSVSSNPVVCKQEIFELEKVENVMGIPLSAPYASVNSRALSACANSESEEGTKVYLIQTFVSL